MSIVLVSSNELKDKDYTEPDVRHAADKVLQSGGNKMLFIEGPRSTADGDFKATIEHDYCDRNFMLYIISYQDFFLLLCWVPWKKSIVMSSWSLC